MDVYYSLNIKKQYIWPLVKLRLLEMVHYAFSSEKLCCTIVTLSPSPIAYRSRPVSVVTDPGINLLCLQASQTS